MTQTHISKGIKTLSLKLSMCLEDDPDTQQGSKGLY